MGTIGPPEPLAKHHDISQYHSGVPGLGSNLLVDAAKRALFAAEFIGARAIVVQALDGRAKSFHARFGFRAFSMLLLRISEPRTFLDA